MELIDNIKELEENLTTLENYMNSKEPFEKKFQRDLIKKGICFVSYKKGSRNLFAPSRFIGYKHNNMQAHIANKSKDGGETNPRISEILHSSCKPDQQINSLYRQFCSELGFDAKETGSFGVERKFWAL
jgi:hypothetical protein